MTKKFYSPDGCDRTFYCWIAVGLQLDGRVLNSGCRDFYDTLETSGVA